MAKDNLSSNTLKQLEQILAQRKRYKIKTDVRSNRSMDINPTIDNVAEVLATLIRDLQKQKILD